MAGKHSGVWVPDKDFPESTLRCEGLRCATEFWVSDNDIPGSSLRYEGLRCATSERKIGVFAEFVKYAGKFLRKFKVRDFSCSFLEEIQFKAQRRRRLTGMYSLA